jgi:RHS repeat-associated protein
MQTTLSYDSRDRIRAVNVKNGETPYVDLEYTWDNNNNITQVVHGWRDTTDLWHEDTETYVYDGLDRLTSAYCASWSHTYTHDKTGNRTSKDGTTYTINEVNEITALSDGTTFTYDANGNMIEKTAGHTTWSYTYNHFNELINVKKEDTTISEYVYDGDGKRITATENNITTVYIYSGLNILYEENPTGTSCYIYGPTGLCAKKTATQGEVHTFYYHTDHLGSTRLVTDESAAIVFHAEYEPFGESITTGPESYLYTGKEKDVTGLYYYGARYYDSEIGRFITKDPLAGEKINPQSLNSYTYCLNNPIKLIDPEGLFYKMCLENGSCLWIWEGTGHWSAKDAAGSTITDSAEIADFLAQGMILEAVVKILQIFGFNVSEDDIYYCKSYK